MYFPIDSLYNSARTFSSPDSLLDSSVGRYNVLFACGRFPRSYEQVIALMAHALAAGLCAETVAETESKLGCFCNALIHG